MTEYNELTKVLLAAGYDAETFPKDKVRIPHGGSRTPDMPLDNYYGGFEYNRAYSNTLIFRTGCGKFVYGKNVLSGMGYQGIEWCLENYNPVVRCPYDRPDCPDNDPLLHGTMGGGLCIQCWCVCHPTDAPYDYDNSFEKLEEERQKERKQKYLEYEAAHNGRICPHHMYYDERTKTWELKYDPGDCARLKCTGMCPILGRELDRKKGNVYYDVKSTFRRYDLDGTLFEGQVDTTLKKGIRKFKFPVSMDICRNYVKLCKEDLIREVILNDYHSELFFAKYHGRQFGVEILNIRAEQRESRDLAQDLEDIKNGIKVQHVSDREKADKKLKSQRRQKNKEAKIARLEKKLLEIGYHNLEPPSLDRIHADKWLGEQRIEELEALRQQKLLKQDEEPKQLSLSDLLETEVA